MEEKVIVATKIKNYIKEKHSSEEEKFLVPPTFIEALDASVKSTIDKAVARRKGNGGKKLKECDI